MNKKGFYGALIGLMALVMLTGFIYLMQGTQQAQRAGIERENILEVNKQWQRAAYLLDKATADALGDAAFEGSGVGNECTITGAPYQAKITGYFNSILNQFDCTYSNLVVTENGAGPWDMNVNLDLNCFQTAKDSTAWMNVQAKFEKRIETTDYRPGLQVCNVKVYDKQANNLLELDLDGSI